MHLVGAFFVRYYEYMKSTQEQYKILLREHGFKATDQRVSLLSVLGTAKEPLALRDIMKKMKGEKIHEVTLYRMLASFKDGGLVRQLDFQDSVPYFELMDHMHDHHHVVCTKCKRVSDFVGCPADDLVKKALVQSKDFAKITHHSFEFFGICKKCLS